MDRFFEDHGDDDEDRFFDEVKDDDADRFFEEVLGDGDEDRPFEKLETEENHEGTSGRPSGSYSGTVVPPPEPTDGGRGQQEVADKTDSVDRFFFKEVGDDDEDRFFKEVGADDEDRFFDDDADGENRFFEEVLGADDEDQFFGDVLGADDQDRPFKKLETEENHHEGSFGRTAASPPEPTDGRSQGQQEEKDKTDSVDALLAHKFAALTTEERQQVMNDIHCVSEPFPESPEFVDEKISELSALLKGGSSTVGDKTNLRQAYDKAVEQDPEYVEGRSFLLQFLRAGSFDPENAAQRILRHFHQKLTLFGQEKLTKTITLEDMGEEENKLLRVGWCGKLPLRDMSSRSVIYANPIAIATIQHEIPSISRMRVLMYTILSLAEEEEDQRRGFVLVSINMGENTSSFGKDVSKNNAAVIGMPPVKLVAIHIFYGASETAFFEHLRPSVNTLDKNAQVRMRIHSLGQYDYKQLHFLLNTHGIPASVIPLREDGKYDLMYHNEYLRARKALEAERQQQSDCSRNTHVLSPGPRDVIHGFDNFARSHVGNVKFLSLVEQMFPEYDAIYDRLRRPIIYQQLLDKIHDSGGLFLYKDDDGLWREASHKMAMDKIGNAFRSRRKIIKREEARKLKRTAPSSTSDESS